jgi:hypothetical protein
VPEPALAPVMFVADTVQLYVAPVTPLGVLSANEVATPEQIVCEEGVEATFGIGFTVIV